jgi:hypothetical protein
VRLGPRLGHLAEAGLAEIRLWEPPDEIYRRLRPEKSQEVAQARGFDSRHLHERRPTGRRVAFLFRFVARLEAPEVTTRVRPSRQGLEPGFLQDGSHAGP